MTNKDQQTIFFRSKEARQVAKQSVQKVDHSEETLYKGKLTLTWKERAVLECMMLTPIIVVFAVLYTTHSFVLTLLGFHIALIAYPIYFAKKKNVKIDWIGLLKQDLQKYARKLKQDVNWVAAPTVMITCCYIGFRICFPEYAYHKLRVPSINETLTAVLLVIEFIFINPVVEEIFWRFFCDLFTGMGKSVLHKIDVAFHFALYHWFVVYYMSSDVYVCTGGAIALFVLGYTLTVVKQKYGIITAMIIHVGVDLAAGIAVYDVQSRFPLLLGLRQPMKQKFTL